MVIFLEYLTKIDLVENRFCVKIMSIFNLILPLSYGVVKNSGSTTNVQPFDFACCIRFTAMAMFADLSVVTDNCNTAARILSNIRII